MGVIGNLVIRVSGQNDFRRTAAQVREDLRTLGRDAAVTGAAYRQASQGSRELSTTTVELGGNIVGGSIAARGFQKAVAGLTGAIGTLLTTSGAAQFGQDRANKSYLNSFAIMQALRPALGDFSKQQYKLGLSAGIVAKQFGAWHVAFLRLGRLGITPFSQELFLLGGLINAVAVKLVDAIQLMGTGLGQVLSFFGKLRPNNKLSPVGQFIADTFSAFRRSNTVALVRDLGDTLLSAFRILPYREIGNVFWAGLTGALSASRRALMRAFAPSGALFRRRGMPFRAPAGGVHLGGRGFRGGEFLPTGIGGTLVGVSGVLGGRLGARAMAGLVNSFQAIGRGLARAVPLLTAFGRGLRTVAKTAADVSILIGRALIGALSRLSIVLVEVTQFLLRVGGALLRWTAIVAAAGVRVALFGLQLVKSIIMPILQIPLLLKVAATALVNFAGKLIGIPFLGTGLNVAKLAGRLTGLSVILKPFIMLLDFVSGLLGSIARKLIGLTLGVGAIGSIILTIGVVGSAKLISGLAKAADRLKIMTERLMEFRFAAKMTSVDAATLERGLGTMARKIASAAKAPTDKLNQSLAMLGLNAAKLVQMPIDQQFVAIAEAISKLDNSSEQALITFRLFGRQGESLLNIIRLGKKGIDEFAADMERLNPAISRLDAARVEVMNEAFLRLSELFRGIFNQLTIKLAPAIEMLTSDFIDFATDSGTVGELVDLAFQQAVVGIGYAADAIQKFARLVLWAAGIVIEKLGAALQGIANFLEQNIIGKSLVNTMKLVVDAIVAGVLTLADIAVDAAVTSFTIIQQNADSLLGTVGKIAGKLFEISTMYLHVFDSTPPWARNAIERGQAKQEIDEARKAGRDVLDEMAAAARANVKKTFDQLVLGEEAFPELADAIREFGMASERMGKDFREAFENEDFKKASEIINEFLAAAQARSDEIARLRAERGFKGAGIPPDEEARRARQAQPGIGTPPAERGSREALESIFRAMAPQFRPLDQIADNTKRAADALDQMNGKGPAGQPMGLAQQLAARVKKQEQQAAAAGMPGQPMQGPRLAQDLAARVKEETRRRIHEFRRGQVIGGRLDREDREALLFLHRPRGQRGPNANAWPERFRDRDDPKQKDIADNTKGAENELKKLNRQFKNRPPLVVEEVDI